MKLCYLLLMLSLTSLGFDYPVNELTSESKIENVLVYQNSARVTRTTLLQSVEKEEYLIKIENISPFIDKKSVQIKLNGEGHIAQVKYRKNYLHSKEFKEQQVELSTSIKSKKDSIIQIDLLIQSLEEHKLFLKSNMLIKGDNESLTLNNLSSISEYYSMEIKDIIFALNKNHLLQNKLKRSQAMLVAQLEELKPKINEVPYDVLINVSSYKNQSISIEMKYQVGNAGWFSSYHLRASSIDEPIQLIHFANVHQKTGEDWENVQLGFTNEDDRVSKNLPTLYPMYAPPRSQPRAQHRRTKRQPAYYGPIDHVTGSVYDQTGMPLIGANVLIENSTLGTITDIDGNFYLDLPPGTQNLVVHYTGFSSQTIAISHPQISITLEEGMLIDEVVVTALGTGNKIKIEEQPKKPVYYSYAIPESKMEENQLNFSFVLKEPYTVLSDGKNNEIALRDISMEASYKYKAIPKLTSKVYLMAFIDDWEDKNLLTGNMNLYFEGAYIGKSLLNPSQLQDSMQISLGVDSKIRVERNRVKYYTKERLFQEKKCTEIGYEIKVKNDKKIAIDLEIWDQIPKSTLKEIKVSKKEISPGFMLNEDDGIGYWKFKLDSGKQRTLKLFYELKYPNHYHFNF